MKKLMIVAAAALGMTAFADIESVNVVGYIEKSTPQAKFMIGTVPFETCSNTMKINELLSGLTPVEIDWEGDYTAFQLTSAQIQIWNGTGYDMAYYVSNAWYDNGTEDGDYKEGWCDMDGVLRDSYEFIPGGAYWVKNVPDSKSLTIAGQIKAIDTVTFNCPNKFMLAGNAFPSPIALNGGTDMVSKDIKAVAIDWEGDYTAFQTAATQMQIWNGTGYDMSYYVSNAWYDNGTEDGDYKEGWCDMDGVLREDYIIPAGNGFWIKATSGECNLEFNNPIK